MARHDDLTGQVALVTGASSGLGHRFARVLHEAGATVVLTARRADRLRSLAQDLGTRAVSFPCDLSDDRERTGMIDQVVESCGGLDVLVNNAGVGGVAPAETVSIDDFRRTLEINLVAPFHLAQLAGRKMIGRGGGSIINIASIFGLVAATPLKHVGYCAAKGGVVNMTRQLGCEWARHNVRVNAIAPGWFETEMTEGIWSDARAVDYVHRETPAGRRGEASELDAAVLLLAGQGGSFINGQTIAVDGGWTAR